MQIPITYIDTTKHFEVIYKKEYMGFVLTRYNHDTKRRDSALLSGACLWPIDKLQKIINWHQEGYYDRPI